MTRLKDTVIAPSLLSAFPLAIGEGVKSLKGETDWLHLDIMDGHFVPNLSYGPELVRSLRNACDGTVLDVHLMVEPPERFISTFAAAGADYLTIHVEATPHLHKALEMIRNEGCKPGVTLNPGTPVEWLKPVLHMVELVLVMSVNPGFGGQAFIPETLEKTRSLARWRAARNFAYLIEMDGGLDLDTLEDAVRAGADVVVAGSAVFGSKEPAEMVRALKKRALEAIRD
ncbi:MAG: ribulose-phosphate 3-epimerase [Thermovirgaceae bacterium]